MHLVCRGVEDVTRRSEPAATLPDAATALVPPPVLKDPTVHAPSKFYFSPVNTTRLDWCYEQLA